MNDNGAPTNRQALDETFSPGAIVVLSLSNPREKFWGLLIQLSTTGAAIRGIDVSSFDETMRMIRHSEPVQPSEIFFPLHRVERIEVDAPSCGVPSLRERFESGIGTDVGTFLQR